MKGMRVSVSTKIFDGTSADGTEAEGRKITGYIFVLAFVDDVRCFGTDDLVGEYETEVQKHCKCKLEGESKEFMSIQILFHLN